MRADRLGVLRKIVNGDRPEVQRTQLVWFVRDGWVAAVSPGEYPGCKTVTMTADALRLLGYAEGDIKLHERTTKFPIRLQLGGYRSDKVMRSGRK